MWAARMWVALCSASLAGCRCAGDPLPEGSAGSIAAGAAGSAAGAAVAGGAPPPECQRAGVALTLRPSGPPEPAPRVGADAEPDPDPSLDLPFSIEPGMAVERGGRFFATALRHEPHGSVALLAELGSAGSAPPSPGAAPPLIELARLEGDVPPPRLTLDGDDLWAAVEMPAAGGYQVRVARLAQASLGAPLEWRDGPRPSRDESNAYDFAATHGQVLFAWDDFPKGESHGRVYVMALARAGAPPAPPAAVALSGADVDAEEPRLAARPGGFWLAWLVDVASKQGRSRVYDPGESEAGGSGAAAGTAAAGAGPSSGPDQATAYGARGIEIVALDAAGKPAGNVQRIRTENARVVGYDLVTSPGGGAWLVWRQDAPSPGGAGGRVLWAEVQNDGPREPQLVREEDVGSGAPGWLVAGDPQSPGSPEPRSFFLSFPDQRDRTLILPVAAAAPPGEPLSLAPDLQGAAALAAGGGKVLFALPRGRSLELFAAACQRAL